MYKLKLRLKIDADNDNTGELFGELEADKFAGQGSAWFELKKLTEQAKRFSEYPISDEEPPIIEGGYWKKDTSAIEQEHLFISAYPIGSRGVLGIMIRLSVPYDNPERIGLKCRTSAEFLVHYEQLGQFSKDIQALAAGTMTEVVIEQHVEDSLSI